MTEKFEKLLSNVMEALAVLIVTSCVLPVLVLLFLLWIVKMLTGIDFNLRSGINGVLRVEMKIRSDLPFFHHDSILFIKGIP